MYINVCNIRLFLASRVLNPENTMRQEIVLLAINFKCKPITPFCTKYICVLLVALKYSTKHNMHCRYLKCNIHTFGKVLTR